MSDSVKSQPDRPKTLAAPEAPAAIQLPDSPAPELPIAETTPAAAENPAGAGNPEPAKDPKKPKKKRRLIWRLIRFAVRAAALLALIGLAGITILFFKPFSFDWLDRRIKDEAEARTGLRVAFPHALISLSRGEIEINNPSASDPVTGEKLIGLTSLETVVDVNSIWQSWRSGVWRVAIPRISAAGSLAFDFEERDGSFSPGPKLARLREIVEARAKATQNAPPSAAPSAPSPGVAGTGALAAAPPVGGAAAHIERVDLSGVELNVVRVDANGAREPEFALRELTLLAEFGDSLMPALVIANGRLEGRGGRTPINIRIQPDEEDDEFRFDLGLPEFDSDLHMLFPPSRRIIAGRIAAEGVLRREGENIWAVVSSAKSPALTLAGAGKDGADERLDDASLYTTVRWIGPDRRLACEIHQFESKQASLVGSAWLDLSGPNSWLVDLAPLEVRSGGLDLVEARVFHEAYLVGPTAAATAAAGGASPAADPDGAAPEPPPRVEIRGGASGLWGSREIKSLDLTYLAEGVALKFPELPDPVTRVRVEGKADLERITVSEGFVVFQGIPFKLSGEVHGRMAEARVDAMSMNWETAGRVEGISDLLARNSSGGAADVSFKGEVMGKGSVALKLPEAGEWSEALAKARIEGEISFNQAELTHRKFKEPIRDLRGTVKLKGSRAELVGVSGRVEDAAFGAGGTISGEGQFWKTPILDLKLSGSGKLENSARYFGWFDKTPPEDWPEARGAVSVEGTIRGKWDDPKAWDFAANVTVRELALGLDQFKNKRIAGQIDFPRLEVAIAPASIRIAPAEGSWGGVRASLSGEFTPQGGDARATVSGQSTDLKKILPDTLKRFDVGGLAIADNHLAIARLASAPSVKRFTDFLLKSEPTPGSTERAGKSGKKSSGKAKPTPKPVPKPVADPSPKPGSKAGSKWLARLKEEWAFKIDGVIKAEGAEVTMDVFPTRVTDVTGSVKYENNHIWSVEPIEAKLGVNAEGTRVGIDVVIHDLDDEAAPPTIIQTKVTGAMLDLDEWVHRWRKPDPAHLDQVPRADVRPKPKLIVTVAAASDRFRYNGIEGTNVSGNVEFQYFARKQDKLFVRDARARDSTGSVLLNGRMESLKEYHESEWVVHADDVNAAEVVRAFFGIENQGGLTSGRVTGNLRLHKEGPMEGGFKGELGFLVRDSRFVSNAVLGGLGRTLKIDDLFGDITFSEIQGSVDIDGGRASFTGDKFIRMQNPSLLYPLDLKIQGEIGPESKLDLHMTLRFLPAVSKAPIVGGIWRMVNSFAGKLLQYRVGGTMKDPKFVVLPFQ